MNDLTVVSIGIISFLSGFSVAIVTFIIGGYAMVKNGTASKLTNL